MNNSSNVTTAILFDINSDERERIKKFIINHHAPYLNLLDEHDCPTKTLASIAQHKPNVLFLSANSNSTAPNKGVLFFMEALQNSDFVPHIIIANPASGESFFPSQALRINHQEVLQTHCFVAGVNKKYYQFELNSIAYIKAKGDTALIYFLPDENNETKTKTVNQSLIQLEKILPQFLRIGRFYLINPKSVKSIGDPKGTCGFGRDLFITDFTRPNLLSLINYFEKKEINPTFENFDIDEL